MQIDEAIISLKPKYTDLILKGVKTVELRKRVMKVSVGTKIWIYSTLPEGRIQAVAEVKAVDKGAPCYIWEKFGKEIGVPKNIFESYTFNRPSVFVLILHKVESINPSPDLNYLRQKISGFQPPQFFKRIQNQDFCKVIKDFSFL